MLRGAQAQSPGFAQPSGDRRLIAQQVFSVFLNTVRTGNDMQATVKR